jgi:hypothetical protein
MKVSASSPLQVRSRRNAIRHRTSSKTTRTNSMHSLPKSDAKEPSFDMDQLNQRAVDLRKTRQVIDAFDAGVESLHLDQFQRELSRAREEAERRPERRLKWVVLSFVVFVSVAFWWSVRRLYGDPRGLRELAEQRRHLDGAQLFEELLKFIVYNSYSLKVNLFALGYLQPIVPKTYEGMVKVSDAANERRSRGPGMIHEEVGRRLHQIAKGYLPCFASRNLQAS